MNDRTVERVERWDTRPFTAGYAGLRDLADAEFSGAVRAGGPWLFLLNGRVVGVFEGSMDDVEGAEGTVYEAPDPSLPLLFAMWERGGDTRAKYYTNDTPVSEADETLSSGSFTGFLELSENVLSGDYYVVYYGGRSMSVAFVGNDERRVTGRDAFDRADDEVGIYEVRDVDVEVVDVPAPATEDAQDDGDDAATDEAIAGATTGDDTTDATTGDDTTDDAGFGADSGASAGDTGRDTAPGDAGSSGTAETGGTAETAGAAGPGEGGEDDADATTAAADAAGTDPDGHQSGGGDAVDGAGGPATTADDGAASPSPDRSVDADNAASRSGEPQTSGTGPTDADTTASATQEAASSPDAGVEGEDAWQRRRSIPALDPDRTASPGDADGSADTPGRSGAGRETTNVGGAGGARTAGGAGRGRTTGSGDREGDGSDAAGRETAAASAATAGSDDTLEPEMLEREDRIDRLQQRLSDLESDRDELQAERDGLRQDRESLQGRVEELEEELGEAEAEIDRLESALERAEGSAESTGGTAAERLSPTEALDGANLFVRYASKGEPTLESARDEDADPEAVNANMRIEHHTQFDADDVSVEGESFRSFLEGTMEFRFVEWAVRTLPFEVRDTGNADGLADLYGALSRIDRAELRGQASLRYTEDGEEVREQQAFDVVLRDRMGNPLAVANLNDSRSPATREMMETLEETATRVEETNDDLAGAFLVTASFFQPGALEAADEATSGGFLSRDSKKSYVKRSRKRGYHLCLVESRAGDFHVTVPEL